jgi:hypothetical protein
MLTSLAVTCDMFAITQLWKKLSQINLNKQVKPELKKADNCCVFNYRPVSPLTDLSNISNKTVYEFLTQRVPFKEKNLKLEKVYRQSNIQLHR